MAPTEKGNEKWLVISYHAFAPTLACSQHVLTRIRHMREQGCKVLLLYALGELGDPDYAFRVRELSVQRLLNGSATRGSGSARWRIIHRLAKFIGNLETAIVGEDTSILWALSGFLLSWRKARRFGPDVIYSTTGSVSAHIIAWAYARLLRKPWVAEYQDPFTFQYDISRLLRIAMRVERLVARRADLTVTVIWSAAEAIQARQGKSDQYVVVYPGADPQPNPPEASPIKHGKLKIGHFGTLCGTRNLDSIFQALSGLESRMPGFLESIELNLWGECQRISESIAAWPHNHIVKIHGLVPPDQARLAMYDCDLLLVIQNASAVGRETIPSKVYEYLTVEKKILGLVYDNEELRRIFREHNDWVADVTNPDEIGAVILQIVEAWKQDNLGKPTKSKYLAADATKQFLEHFHQKVPRRQTR